MTKPKKGGPNEGSGPTNRKGRPVKSASCDRTSTTRSLVLPIAGPVDATWPELRVALREAWGETTRAANWMLTELYARDIRRGAQDKKLGKMPKVYLYPEARKLFPLLASQTLSSLDQIGRAHV